MQRSGKSTPDQRTATKADLPNARSPPVLTPVREAETLVEVVVESDDVDVWVKKLGFDFREVGGVYGGDFELLKEPEDVEDDPALMAYDKAHNLSPAVDRIINHVKEDGQYKFKVKWRGLPIDQCTWEHEQSLAGCVGIIREYFEKRSYHSGMRCLFRLTDKKTIEHKCYGVPAGCLLNEKESVIDTVQRALEKPTKSSTVKKGETDILGSFWEGDVPIKITRHRFSGSMSSHIDLLVKWKKRADKTRPQSTWYTNAELRVVAPDLLANYLNQLCIEKISQGKKLGKSSKAEATATQSSIPPTFKKRHSDKKKKSIFSSDHPNQSRQESNTIHSVPKVAQSIASQLSSKLTATNQSSTSLDSTKHKSGGLKTQEKADQQEISRLNEHLSRTRPQPTAAPTAGQSTTTPGPQAATSPANNNKANTQTVPLRQRPTKGKGGTLEDEIFLE